MRQALRLSTPLTTSGYKVFFDMALGVDPQKKERTDADWELPNVTEVSFRGDGAKVMSSCTSMGADENKGLSGLFESLVRHCAQQNGNYIETPDKRHVRIISIGNDTVEVRSFVPPQHRVA